MISQMDRGWVKLYRCIDQWDYYDSPNTLAVLIWLILNVNYKDNNWHERLIKRGQIVTSIKTLTKDTKQTTAQVRTALKHLKGAGTITIEGTPNFSIITLVNYCFYQDADTRKGKPQKPYKGIHRADPVDKKTTNQPQTSNYQTTTNKEEKEENNLNKKENITRNTTTFGLQQIGSLLPSHLKIKSGADV